MQVRGIECDAWLSMGSIPNYGWWNLTYYFVASDWSNPSHMARWINPKMATFAFMS